MYNTKNDEYLHNFYTVLFSNPNTYQVIWQLTLFSQEKQCVCPCEKQQYTRKKSWYICSIICLWSPVWESSFWLHDPLRKMPDTNHPLKQNIWEKMIHPHVSLTHCKFPEQLKLACHIKKKSFFNVLPLLSDQLHFYEGYVTIFMRVLL